MGNAAAASGEWELDGPSSRVAHRSRASGLGHTVDGRFVLDALVARGGMGTIYRAFDLDTGDFVALKVLAAHADVSAWRFELEARIARVVTHPFMARYVAHGQCDDGAPYLALEWLDGEDLASRLTRGTLAVGEALAVLRHVSLALRELHFMGIVHRDIKPANVFLCEGRPARAKLIDFGVARPVIRSTSFDPDRTARGVAVGTPQYMAPEQLLAEPVDQRTDVFALGLLLFECLTGFVPFAADSIAVMLRRLSHRAPTLSECGIDVPLELDALCARMLDQRPDRRPADASAVLDLLESSTLTRE